MIQFHYHMHYITVKVTQPSKFCCTYDPHIVVALTVHLCPLKMLHVNRAGGLIHLWYKGTREPTKSGRKYGRHRAPTNTEPGHGTKRRLLQAHNTPNALNTHFVMDSQSFTRQIAYRCQWALTVEPNPGFPITCSRRHLKKVSRVEFHFVL